MSKACFLRFCVSFHLFLEDSIAPSSVLVGRCWGGEGASCSLVGPSPSVLSPVSFDCPFRRGLPFSSWFALRSCARLISCWIHWLSSLFPSRLFEGPSPDLIRGPFLGMILLCLPSALSVAFKCLSLSLNLQTFCGVAGNSVGFGLFFGHRSLEACRILSPGTAPGVGHVWFQFVFVDFMVLCICLFFIVDLFLKSLLNLLQYCFHFVFWCFWLPNL